MSTINAVRPPLRQRLKPGFVILSIAFAIPALMSTSTIVRLVLGVA